MNKAMQETMTAVEVIHEVAFAKDAQSEFADYVARGDDLSLDACMDAASVLDMPEWFCKMFNKRYREDAEIRDNEARAIFYMDVV